MRCRKCGAEIFGGSICRTCLRKFTDIRTEVWDKLVLEMGKPTKENMFVFRKRFKKLEKQMLQ